MSDGEDEAIHLRIDDVDFHAFQAPKRAKDELVVKMSDVSNERNETLNLRTGTFPQRRWEHAPCVRAVKRNFKLRA